ncbi:DUF6907 domain-containing protein [Nocardia sp. NBC_01377]|uniref:DUF6907 domain-containing protein n=1 Tax=Nocardia sp. NBC_01377 TaxID=2903595 RepID=UPI003864F3DE
MGLGFGRLGVSGDLWGVVVAVVFSCPSWCVDHRGALPGDPPGGGAHYGPEVAVNLYDQLEFDTTRQVWIQSSAHDREGHRQCLIGVIDPHGVGVELSTADARRAARILILGADLVLAPADGACPSWCLGHSEVGHELGLAAVEHRGPFMVVRHPHPYTCGVAIAVRVSAFDFDDRREVCLELITHGLATDLTGSEACKIAAHLLNAADQIDAG